jgi:urea transporter
MFYDSPGRSPAWRVGVPLAVQGQLSAIAQIYLQSSPIFGTVVLLCLYLTQPTLALGCLLGACIASATAWVMAFPDEDRRQGLYSFNAALSGAGLCAGYQFGATLAAWIAVIAVLTALLSRAAQRAGIPVLTSLFVGAMWLTLAVAPSLGLQTAAADSSGSTNGGGCGLSPFSYLLCVFGQVSFIGPAALGMLVWAVLARQRWHLAMWTLAGAALAWCVAGSAEMLLRWPVITSQATGMGINSALAMLALGTLQRSWPQRVLGATLSILVCLAIGTSGQPYFTLPFVLATWVVLPLDGRLRWKTMGE